MEYLLLFGAGFLGGFLSGLLGIGGGLIYILVLEEVFRYSGISPEFTHQFVIANSFFVMLFSSLAANISLIRAREFYFKQVVVVGFFSVLVATLVQEVFVNTEYYHKSHFNILMLLLVIIIFIKMMIRRNSKVSKTVREVKSREYAIGGVAGGIIATVSGLGGGIITVPMLHSVFKLDYKSSRSISLGVIFLTALFITFLNLVGRAPKSSYDYTLGYIVFPVSLIMVIGVVVASPIGVLVSRKMKGSTISLIYIIFLLLFFGKKLFDLIHDFNS